MGGWLPEGREVDRIRRQNPHFILGIWGERGQSVSPDFQISLGVFGVLFTGIVKTCGEGNSSIY